MSFETLVVVLIGCGFLELFRRALMTEAGQKTALFLISKHLK